MVILAACLVAFSWKSYASDDEGDNGRSEEQEQLEEMDEVENTDIEEETPPPPPPAPEEPELNLDEIEVKQDDEKRENEVKTSDLNDESQKNDAPVVPEDEEEEEEKTIFTVVESAPSFPGGDEALYKYLAENIKYPQLARDNGFQGKVYLTFVVERDGSITDIKVLRDIGGGCGAEATRVVKSMPKWTPGKQRGKAVRVQFNLPVNFKLKG